MVALNEDLNYHLQMLDATLARCPVQMDSEKTRSYLPKMPCQTPPYYPQVPLPNADSLEYYLRLSVEALFFTFYYMEVSVDEAKRQIDLTLLHLGIEGAIAGSQSTQKVIVEIPHKVVLF